MSFDRNSRNPSKLRIGSSRRLISQENGFFHNGNDDDDKEDEAEKPSKATSHQMSQFQHGSNFRKLRKN